MNNSVKISLAVVAGAVIGVAATYVSMTRLMNWFDLVAAASRAEITLSALKDFESDGMEQGIESLREALEIEIYIVEAKCEYFKCSDNAEKYSSELSTIEQVGTYLDSAYNKKPQPTANASAE